MKEKILFIKNNLKNSFRKYFDFRSRASRSEFWIFNLFFIFFSFLPFLIFVFLELTFLDQGKSLLMDYDLFVTNGINENWSESEIEKQLSLVWDPQFDLYSDIIFLLSALPFFIPFMSIAFRRLHDFGKPGYFCILYLIIIILVEFYNVLYPDTNDYIFLSILISIVFYSYISKKADKRKNQYGPVPKIKKK